MVNDSLPYGIPLDQIQHTAQAMLAYRKAGKSNG